jgi:hypothetical protein
VFTVTENGEPLFLFDSREDDPDLPVILAFGAEHGAELLANNQK